MSPVQKTAVREIRKLSREGYDMSSAPVSWAQRKKIHDLFGSIRFYTTVILENEKGR